MSKKQTAAEIGLWVASAWTAAAVGAILSRGSEPAYYKALEQPSWSPPPQVFGPVWSVLYTMMGLSAWLLWRNREKPGARVALWLYVVQLVLNCAWSPTFFGLHKPREALYVLVGLWAALLGLTVTSWKVSRTASLLLWPYLAWTTFAGALNAKIVELNPEQSERPAIHQNV